LFIIKLLYFASAATDLQTEKYLGCSRKIVAFATAYLFISIKTFSHSLPTIVGKDEIHFIPSPSRYLSYSVHLWQTQDPFLSISIKKFSLVQYNCGKDKIHHIFPMPSRHFLSSRAIVQRQRCLISTEMQRKNQGCLVCCKSFVFCPELPCQRKELHEKAKYQYF
jgi:hypothetical protein